MKVQTSDLKAALERALENEELDLPLPAPEHPYIANRPSRVRELGAREVVREFFKRPLEKTKE